VLLGRFAAGAERCVGDLIQREAGHIFHESGDKLFVHG